MQDDSSISLVLVAEQLLRCLHSKNLLLVLTESCTAGLVAATLGGVPGASHVLCGSLVVYRNRSKHEWLDISTDLLDDPGRGPVSADATRCLAMSALSRTSEADVSIAITGHLGPFAPRGMDGIVFLAIAKRPSNIATTSIATTSVTEPELVCEASCKLESDEPRSAADITARMNRQKEACRWALATALEYWRAPSI